MTDSSSTTSAPRGFNPLNWIEWIGNKLPDPVTLFAVGAILVMVLSWWAAEREWEVVQELPRAVMEEVEEPQTGESELRPVVDPDTGRPRLEWEATGVVYTPRSLLSRDGIDWALSSMVNNFRMFPPLGVVLVGMLGIGVAERTGLLAAVLKAFMLGLRGFLELFTPRRWDVANKVLSPAMVFIGVMSSLATDAGYVVLPPLAAALYKSVGRSPLAGLAAVFAGVSAGFSANLLITGLEPMLAELTGIGAVIVEPGYRVNPMCNWWFMIVSTIVITLVGWFVTAALVERRLNRRTAEEGGPSPPTEDEMAGQQLTAAETRGLWWAAAAALATAAVVLAFILVPGAPLHTYKMPLLIEDGRRTAIPDDDALQTIQQELRQAADEENGRSIQWVGAEVWPAEVGPPSPETQAHVRGDGLTLVETERRFDRWVDAIVPLLFFGFIIPGIAYGLASRAINSDKDVAKLMMQSMAAMAPIIVLAFVAGQFIAYFAHSRLDVMMAVAGGMWLGKAGFSPYTLVIAFILVTLLFNLFMGSMSAKYALFAPIFIPMFMFVGISPELTQAAYRVGDSVSNIITPLNPYLIIILVFMQKYVPRGGMGTLIATMLPYTIVFTIVWSILLLIWMWTGLPLGIDGGLWYDIATATANDMNAN